MTDIALHWDNQRFAAAMAISAGALASDDGLRTAIIVSLFSDARAAPDDSLPEANADRRGWWGDMVSPVTGWELGSRLWLLAREKQLVPVLARAESYARAALQWMVDDRVAAAFTVSASFPRVGWLALEISIDRPGGPARERYDFVWAATAEQLRIAA